MGCGFVPVTAVMQVLLGYGGIVQPSPIEPARRRTVSQAPNLRAALRVAPGRRVDLAKVDPGDTHGFDRESGEGRWSTGCSTA